MAQEVMMVPTKDYDNLVNFYKGRITESTLLNKAGRLAAERHLTLTNRNVSDSVALAITKPKAREIGRLTKRIRTGGAVSSGGPTPTAVTDEDDGDDMSLTPLEHKLDKILRATKKITQPQPQLPSVKDRRKRPYEKLEPAPKRKKMVTFKTSPSFAKPVKKETSKEGWKKAVGRGALKGLVKKMGVTVSESSDTDSGGGDGAAGPRKKKPTPRALKALRAAPGWEDFTEGNKLRRQLLPECDEEEKADTQDEGEEEELWTPGGIDTI